MINKDLGMVTAYAYAVSKGYTGTEDQFATLMASYADVGQTAVDAALAAKASEDAAKASETASAASQTAAATSAGTATTAAQTATGAATTATTKAGEAAQFATTAGTAATTATTAASEAAQSATQAAASATAAESAKTAAQTAQTAAETAQTAAETAQGAAEAAAQTLVIDPTLTQPNQAAEAKATGDAISLVKSHLEATQIVDSASGAIASFADGADGVPVESLTVSIEPIQDLHGQANPYPGGGGKNLFNVADVENFAGFSETNGTFSNTRTDTRTSLQLTVVQLNGTSIVKQNAINVTEIGKWSITFEVDSEITALRIKHNGQTIDFSFDYPFTKQGTFTFSANVLSADPTTIGGVSFNQVQIEEGSTATAWSPYFNICPISGRQIVKVTRTGANVWGGLAFGMKMYEATRISGGTIDTNTGTVEHSRPDPNAQGQYKQILFDKFKPNTQYTFIITTEFTDSSATGTNNSLRLEYTDGTFTSVTINTDGKTTYAVSTTQGKTVKYIALNYTGVRRCRTYYNKTGLFEGVITAADFVPYEGQTVTIQLGQTVYGGTVDVTTGVLTVDRAMVDISTVEDTSLYTDTNSVALRVPLRPASSAVESAAQTHGAIASCGAEQAAYYGVNRTGDAITASWHGQFAIATTVSQALIYDADTTLTKETFLQKYAGAQICYPLAQPITITLTPEQLTTVLGTNNVWSDGGNVSVEYVADTKLYIERLTEPDADMVADANITSGQYFMVGNTLYLATANIASGAAITPGVNCTRTSLAAALNAINS